MKCTEPHIHNVLHGKKDMKPFRSYLKSCVAHLTRHIHDLVKIVKTNSNLVCWCEIFEIFLALQL